MTDSFSQAAMSPPGQPVTGGAEVFAGFVVVVVDAVVGVDVVVVEFVVVLPPLLQALATHVKNFSPTGQREAVWRSAQFEKQDVDPTLLNSVSVHGEPG